MIKEEVLKKYHAEVEAAIAETFEMAILNQRNPGDFLLFLENGHKSDIFIEGHTGHSIGFGRQNIADHNRQEFINFFYENFKFEDLEKEVEDPKNREYIYKNLLHFDLMIYAHCWESYPNLSRLKQLSNLVANREFDWSIQMPEYSKHDWIRNEIRDVFKSKGLKISEIISRSFHSLDISVIPCHAFRLIPCHFLRVQKY